MTSEVDLRSLAVERPGSSTKLVQGPPRRWISRYVVPGGLVLGFATMIVWASLDRLRPVKSVTVVPVLSTKATVQRAGKPLFQAPGWIEPRPRPVVVSALTEGVIDQLFVVEGQEVEKGEVIARLIDIDARLALSQEESLRGQRLAQLNLAKARLDAARTRFERPVHLDAMVADAESTLAKMKTERAKLPSLISSSTFRLRFAEQDLAGKQGAGGAVSERLIQRSQSDRDAAQAELLELENRGPLLDQEIEALGKRVEALTESRRLLIDERLQLAEAEANLDLAKQTLKQSELALELAKVRLDRTSVRSPISGRVLQVIARPGTRVMGLSMTASQEASNVATLYDPAVLQVRADVRLEDVPNVQPGQPVRVQTASAKEEIRGEVLFTTSSANIQKNTLEVKVALNDPPLTIRPEMLTTVTFLSVDEGPSENLLEKTERILVPQSLIESDGGAATVWIVDHQSLARRRTVSVGDETDGQLVEITSGLQPTDRLISSSRGDLTDGERVAIAGEDPVIGIESQ